MKPRRKSKPTGMPMYIAVREAAAVGNAGFDFFVKYGRLSKAEDDLSEFYVCPFTVGEYYIDELNGNMVVWTDKGWLVVTGNLQAKEDDHFNVDDNDLNTLLNLAGDMLTGQGNMDTALMFSHYLEKVEERLKTNG
ncbi:hypothetical protein D3C80_1467830 [compost metagenome]